MKVLSSMKSVKFTYLQIHMHTWAHKHQGRLNRPANAGPNLQILTIQKFSLMFCVFVCVCVCVCICVFVCVCVCVYVCVCRCVCVCVLF